MKRIAAVVAIVVLNLGMLSCDSEANVQDDNTYDMRADLEDVCDTCEVKIPPKGN